MTNEQIENYAVFHRRPLVELICAPFDSHKRKGHDWNGKSQKKIRRERRQNGGRKDQFTDRGAKWEGRFFTVPRVTRKQISKVFIIYRKNEEEV